MITETTQEETFCCIHGLPIKYAQFGARIQGMAETKDKIGSIDIYVCDECWKVIVQNVEGGLAAARRKQEKLALIDAIREVRDDDSSNIEEPN